MKVRIKNPIWGVPITILNDLCSDGLLHFEVPLKKKKNVPNHRNLKLSKMDWRNGMLHNHQRTESVQQNPHTTCTGLSELTDTLKTTRTTESDSESTEKKSMQESSYNVYKIIGAMTSTKVDEFNHGYPYINGKKIYARILIQRVN